MPSGLMLTHGIVSTDPHGGPVPYVSPEGHTIVDIRFGAPHNAPARVSSPACRDTPDSPSEDGFRLNGEPATSDAIVAAIESVPGVLAHGLAVGRATVCYVPNAAQSTEPRLLFPMTPPRGPDQ